MNEENQSDSQFTIILEAKSGMKGPFEIHFKPDELTVHHQEDSQTYTLPRKTIRDGIQLRPGPLGGLSILILKLDKKSVLFQPNAEDTAVLQTWIGPPTSEHLIFEIKQSTKWTLPLGALFLYMAMPLEGNPDSSFDPITASIGAVLILQNILGRVWKKREIFLLDTLWFSLAAVSISFALIRDFNWFSLIILLFNLAAIQHHYNLYKEFASMKP